MASDGAASVAPNPAASRPRRPWLTWVLAAVLVLLVGFTLLILAGVIDRRQLVLTPEPQPAPAGVAVAGLVGLVSALTGDGWRDGLAWLGLAAPVAAVLWARAARRA